MRGFARSAWGASLMSSSDSASRHSVGRGWSCAARHSADRVQAQAGARAGVRGGVTSCGKSLFFEQTGDGQIGFLGRPPARLGPRRQVLVGLGEADRPCSVWATPRLYYFVIY